MKKQNKHNVIIDATHDGIISVDKDGKIELFNRAAEKILGLKKENIIGKDVEDVIENTRMHHVLKSGEMELNQTQYVGGLTIITNRMPIRNEAGEIIGAVAVFRDVEEVKRFAEEITDLKESSALLEAIINSTQDAISVVDENGYGIMINPAYTKLTGLTEEDVIGKPASVDIAEGKSMHYKVLKTKEPVYNVRMKVGANKKDVIVDVAPIIVSGKLKGSVGVIKDVSEIKKLTEELNQAKKIIRQLSAKYTFTDIVGKSEKMRRIINLARRAAHTPVTVLLRGESGTGKELFAHAIHNESQRRNSKFIRVNCASLTNSILESELFGYEEGAFTGAKKGGKKGLFEEAAGGTIFLDEIGKINLNLQAKLLRVLQEKEIVRVGGSKPIDIDVRIIVASNTDLERAIEKGEFRKDLYYRLNVFPLEIPPLRKRKEDLPLLVNHIIKKLNQEYGKTVKGISDAAMLELSSYDWPGNVRELENILGRAMIYTSFEENIIDVDDLPVLADENEEYKDEFSFNESFTLEKENLSDIVARTERRAIINALKKADGNRTEAAEILGIAVRSLYYKLSKYGINQ
ncbi:MAG: sigma 54-interacting transcriptional regulator [Bacillota bacterium]